MSVVHIYITARVNGYSSLHKEPLSVDYRREDDLHDDNRALLNTRIIYKLRDLVRLRSLVDNNDVGFYISRNRLFWRGVKEGWGREAGAWRPRDWNNSLTVCRSRAYSNTVCLITSPP